MPSGLCRPLLLLTSIFLSIRVFSNESVLLIRWPTFWNLSFNISPSSEYSGRPDFAPCPNPENLNREDSIPLSLTPTKQNTLAFHWKARVGGTTSAYAYNNANWGDQLTSYRGEIITYDGIGNPTSYYNGTQWTFEWSHGRQLIRTNILLDRFYSY